MDRDETLQMLRDIAAGFDTHDVDAIMRHFAEDAVFEGPRGPDPWGRRAIGRDAVRVAFETRFSTIPDVRYREDEHFLDGDRGASRWRLTGTATDGQALDLHGCDLWTIRDGLIVLKDSYWKGPA